MEHSKILHLVLISLWLANLATLAFSGDFPYFHCLTNSTTLQPNINELFSQLSTNLSVSRNTQAQFNKGNDSVYGQYMCLAFVSSSACQTCVTQAFSDIQTLCPNSTDAILWEENCQVRCSKTRFFGQLNVSQNIPLANKINRTDVSVFRRTVKEEIDTLIKEAASHKSMEMFASGARILTANESVYCFVQCSNDLTTSQCSSCLAIAMANISNTFPSSKGARLLSHSCFIRYELYNYYAVFDDLRPLSTANKKANDKQKRLEISFIVITVCASGFTLIGIFWCLRRMKKPHYSADNPKDSRSSMELSTLLTATENFSESNFLGDGFFGPVYKGILRNGEEIAVKKLRNLDSHQGLIQFTNEVVLIMSLQHRNLIKLLGFCVLGSERLLVYEFMPNGSVESILKDERRRRQLDWSKRVNIIQGIGRGMLHLHQDSCPAIIHRDLKAANVLLDTDLNPKISDFGTARSISGSEDGASTSTIIGTRGYIAPEYLMEGLFSVKSDVFSFGVLLLEILTGNAKFHLLGKLESRNGFDIYFTFDYVWQKWNQGNELELKDVFLTDPSCDFEIARYVYIGLLCVQDCPEDRPTMSEVVSMLRNENVSLRRPEMPAARRGSYHRPVISRLLSLDIQ